MIDKVFAIIILFLLVAHYVVTLITFANDPDLLFGKGDKKDE